MKRLLFIAVTIISLDQSYGQHVGIGTSTPLTKLHTSTDSENILILENSTALNTGNNTRMLFKTGSYYTGIIGTYGTGLATSRIGFSTFAHSNPGNLQERMSILDNGNVGINNTSPAYKLDITGSTRVTGSIVVTDDIIRPSSGSANLLPHAYGKIDSDGDILGGTSNFSVERLSTGKYVITLTGEANVYNNHHQYTILATPLFIGPATANVFFTPDNKIAVSICLPSTNVQQYTFEDLAFNFLVYKL